MRYDSYKYFGFVFYATKWLMASRSFSLLQKKAMHSIEAQMRSFANF